MTPIQPIPYQAVEGSWKLAVIMIALALTAGIIITRRAWR